MPVKPDCFYASLTGEKLLEYSDSTAYTETCIPFALKVSKKISAKASLFSGGF